MLVKKLVAIIASITVLMFAFSASASAASLEQKPPITVWMGNTQLSFEVPPMSVNGTTYVEFATLFKAFGYSVTYDGLSKTITGMSAFGNLTLNTANGQAAVNDKPIAKPVQVLNRNGRTLIPLRFIVDATGSKVEWNASAQKVTITSKRPAALAELQALLKKLDALDNAGDYANLLGLIDLNSMFYEHLQGQLESHQDDPSVKLRTTTTLKQVAEWKNDSAIVDVTQLTEKIGGDGFYLDNSSVGEIYFVRGQDNHLRIYDMTLLEPAQYVNTDKVLKQEAQVPADVKSQILQVLDKQTQAANQEDIDTYFSTIDSDSADLSELKVAFQQVFESYDLKYTNEEVRIVNYSDTQAIVYLVQKIERLAGPEYPEARYYVALTFKLTAGGDWVTTTGGVLIASEPLN